MHQLWTWTYGILQEILQTCGLGCWQGKPDPWEEVVEASKLDTQGKQTRKRKDRVRHAKYKSGGCRPDMQQSHTESESCPNRPDRAATCITHSYLKWTESGD